MAVGDPPHEVGDQEADEADDPGVRHRRGREEGGRDVRDPLRPLDGDAEREGGLLAEREGVEGAGEGKEDDEADRGVDREGVDGVPVRACQGAEHPEDEAARVGGVADREEEEENGGGEGVHDDAREEEAPPVEVRPGGVSCATINARAMEATLVIRQHASALSVGIDPEARAQGMVLLAYLDQWAGRLRSLVDLGDFSECLDDGEAESYRRALATANRVANQAREDLFRITRAPQPQSQPQRNRRP